MVLKSQQKTSGNHIVCLQENRISFHTHPSYFGKSDYLIPDGKDLMNTFSESFHKNVPTYSLIIDNKSGYYFYRPSNDLFAQIIGKVNNGTGWEFDIWQSWDINAKYTKLIDDQIDKWDLFIQNSDIEVQLQKKNFETPNEYIQHCFKEIGFDIYFIATDEKLCFNIIEEKIINLVD